MLFTIFNLSRRAGKIRLRSITQAAFADRDDKTHRRAEPLSRPRPFQFTFSNRITAKLTIAKALSTPPGNCQQRDPKSPMIARPVIANH